MRANTQNVTYGMLKYNYFILGPSHCLWNRERERGQRCS